MDATTAIDPRTLIDTLDADIIRRRLAELDSQARALRVLLRAANARERGKDRKSEREVVHA